MFEKFEKYHALGNDYLVTHATEVPDVASIQQLCNRHTGLGSDGILLNGKRHGDVFDLRILNPDGSEAEKSGNGLRIFARFLFDEGLVGHEPFKVSTRGGVVICRVWNPPETVTVEMGQAQFATAQIPVNLPHPEVLDYPLELDGITLRINCVSMGNPHCVILIAADVDGEAMAKKWGATLEHHPLFPGRTNVQFVQVADRNTLKLWIWERGAGYTLASGSSSCAAASVAFRLGLCDRTITLNMPGGQLAVVIRDDMQVEMTGPVTPVASMQSRLALGVMDAHRVL